MTATQTAVLDDLARDFCMSPEALLKESLRAFLERRLGEVRAAHFSLARRYGVASVAEMETLYVNGAIEEANTREDFEALDHLEFKRDELERCMKALEC